jgi:S1-C subfamily serine protease
VVRLQVSSTSTAPQGELGGSGFNISPRGLVVTNRHLVEDASLIRVSFPEQGTFIASEWYVSEQADLALIPLDSSDLPVLTLADDSLLPGDELLVIGNPLQYTRIANRGTLAGYRQTGDGSGRSMVIAAEIYPGNSGSPVFNRAGEVIGVVFATIRGEDAAESLGLAIPVETLKELLAEAALNQ